MHRERRTEIAGFANLAGAHQVDDLEEEWLKVQAIRGHQTDVVVGRSLDHPGALRLGHRQRLLAQHVDTRMGRARGEVRMLGIGGADVDGVYLFQAPVILVVAGANRHAIVIADGVELLDAATDDGVKRGVALGVRERRYYRRLRDVAEPNHCVTNFRQGHEDVSPDEKHVQGTYQPPIKRRSASRPSASGRPRRCGSSRASRRPPVHPTRRCSD